MVCLASVYSQEPVRDESKSIHYLKMAAHSGVSAPYLNLHHTHRRTPIGYCEPWVIPFCRICLWIFFYCCPCLQDDRALLFLGQCYESGLGVQRNVRRATEYYKRAAQAGNKQAKQLLMPPNPQNCKGAYVLLSAMSQCVATMITVSFTFFSPAKDGVLRSISSAPCFAGTHLQQPLSSRLTPSAFTLPLLPHSWSTGSLCIPPLSSSLFPIHPLNTEGGNCQWTVGLGWARKIHLKWLKWL